MTVISATRQSPVNCSIGEGANPSLPAAATSSVAVAATALALTDKLQLSSQAISLYRAAVSGTPSLTVANALKLAATAANGSLVISDTSANLAKSFDALLAIKDKIGAMTQTDAKAIGVTRSQFAAGTSLLQKVNGGNYSAAISGVLVNDLATLKDYGTKVTAVTVADSSANIASHLAEMDGWGTKVTAVTQTAKSAMTMTYASSVTYSRLLALVDKGKYTLNISDSSSTIKTNLAAITKLGAKVEAITQTDASSAIKLSTSELNVNLSALKKINSGAFKVDVEDTSASVLKSWAGLAAIQNNIHALKLTDTAPAMALTASKIKTGLGLIGKISNDSYDLTLADTAANITSNLGALSGLSSKITKIMQTDKTNLTLTLDQFSNEAITGLLAKYGAANYGLAVTGVDKSNLVDVLANAHTMSVALTVSDGFLTSSDSALTAAIQNAKVTSIAVANAAIANLTQLTADKRVKTISVSDTSENLVKTNNLVALDALMKKSKGLITAIDSDADTRSKITVDQATYIKYAATVFSVKKNFALEVDLSALVPANLTDANAKRSIKTTANSNGTFSVQAWDYNKGGYQKAITFNAGVNFLKIGSASTFLDSGDAKLNAVLNVGNFQWQQSSTQSEANTSNYAIKPGVYSLSDGSSKQIIKYKFLSDSVDPALTTAGDRNGFAAMTNTQKASVTNALNYISSLVDVEFQLVTSGADINFGTNNQGSTSGGYATGANAAFTTNGVNLLLNNTSASGAVNRNPQQGDYGWETLIHEVGHTLGLKHPGAYNAGGGVAAGPYLSAADDNRRNTVMSYNDAVDMKNWTSIGNTGYAYSAINPSTYMPLDILALQFLYGKNTTGVSATDDAKSLSNFQTTSFTSSWMGLETLSSTDEGLDVNLSNLNASNIVDLRAGAFSSINIKDASYNALLGSGKSAQTFYNINNVGLSYDSSISNLIGGQGRDVVYVSNKDVTIDGGGGDDKVYLYGDASNWLANVVDDTETDYQNGDVTVKLKNIKTISYYDMSNTSVTHARVDLTA